MKTLAEYAAEKAEKDRVAGEKEAKEAWASMRTRGFGIILCPGREKSRAFRQAFIDTLQRLKSEV